MFGEQLCDEMRVSRVFVDIAWGVRQGHVPNSDGFSSSNSCCRLGRYSMMGTGRQSLAPNGRSSWDGRTGWKMERMRRCSSSSGGCQSDGGEMSRGSSVSVSQAGSTVTFIFTYFYFTAHQKGIGIVLFTSTVPTIYNDSTLDHLSIFIWHAFQNRTKLLVEPSAAFCTISGSASIRQRLISTRSSPSRGIGLSSLLIIGIHVDTQSRARSSSPRSACNRNNIL